MKVRRPFLLALLASIMLHLGIATVPGWHLSILDDLDGEPLRVLDARLARLAAAPLPAPRPVKRKRAAAMRPQPVPAGQQPPEAAPEPQVAAASEPPAPEPEEAPVATVPRELALPRRMDIRYSVSMGTSGFVIGRSVHQLRHDNLTYSMRTTTETTGLAGLFKPIKLVHISEGDIDDSGLQPREFRIERNGVVDERASFDWSAGQVSLSARERAFPLEPGAQDLSSMFCQLALMPIDKAKVTMPVVTGKKVERYEFDVLGEEKVMTELGELAAIHLHTQAATGLEATEVWLAVNQAHLPIRIRYTDRKGEVFDQVADRIQLGTETGDAH